MKVLFVISLLFFTNELWGQEKSPKKFYPRDSVEFNKAWETFKQALVSKDINSLHHLSLKKVNCDLFETPDPTATYDESVATNISIDKFIAEFYQDLSKLKLWSVIKTKRYHMAFEDISGVYLPNVKYRKGKPATIYEIWYLTFEPNEIAKGHEGQSEAFQFIKLNGAFKFCGMTSIP